jgi:HD-GYP domain-containing protein (c-di-GMP phosphodiesterase class II)
VTQHTLHPAAETTATSIRARLRESGVVLAVCDCAGVIAPSDAPSDDWLSRILLDSTLLRRSIERAVAGWNDADDPSCVELMPGCWCTPVPIVSRRKRTGYGLVLVPTIELRDSEQFQALCQSARLDAEVCACALTAAKPVPASEVARIARLAGDAFRDAQRLDEATRTMDSVGQQLAESYEEISLLYTISQSMTVVQQPRRFVNTACQGLLDTLAYRWIGAQFLDEPDGSRSLSGRLIVAGDAGRGVDDLVPLTRLLVEMAPADGPLVLDPASNADHAMFAPLGQPIIIHPICRDGRVRGVMIAAGKKGDDRAATSADLKLIGATATHTGIFLENAALYEDMDTMFLGTLEAISASIDAKDRYTCGHSQRVALLAQQLAVAAGLDEEAVRRVHVAGLVHDVGKIGVPESVLCKPGRLTEAEFASIRQHPEIGFRILKDIPQLRDVLPGVLHHHERWDGRGYPHGLAGESIPLFARLIALADSFDAMSSTRTYRAARERSWVLDEIRRSAGTQFDPRLAPLFIELDFSEFDRLISEHRAIDTPLHSITGEAA